MEDRAREGATGNSFERLDSSTNVAEPRSDNGVQTSRKRRLSDPYTAPEMDLDERVLGLDLDELQNYMRRLEKRATDLKSAPVLKTRPTHRHVILYRIDEYILSGPFLDAPEWIDHGDGQGTLHCKVPIQNFELYLEKNKDIAFIVFKTYATQNLAPDDEWQKDDHLVVTTKECIKPISRELVKAVGLLLRSEDEYADLWHSFEMTQELHAPYLFAFGQRGYPESLREATSQAFQEQLTLLWNYILQKHGDEYRTVSQLLSTSKITSDYLQYLFRPGDILVQRKADSFVGWVSKSRVKLVSTEHTSWEEVRGKECTSSRIPLYAPDKMSKEMANEKVWVQKWMIPAWHWGFDGNFQRNESDLTFSTITEHIPSVGRSTKHASGPEAEVAASTPEFIPIEDLEVFPYQYAPQQVRQQLRRRGQAFWKCRNRKLVSYRECTKDSQESMVSSIPEVTVAC